MQIGIKIAVTPIALTRPPSSGGGGGGEAAAYVPTYYILTF